MSAVAAAAPARPSRVFIAISPLLSVAEKLNNSYRPALGVSIGYSLLRRLMPSGVFAVENTSKCDTPTQ